MHRELIEAVHRLSGSIEGFEQAINLGKFKNFCRCSRNRRQFDVAVPFHRLFKTIEERLNSGAIQASNLRAIKNQTWAICFQRRINFEQ